MPSDYGSKYPAEAKDDRYECLIAKYTNELAVFTKVLAYATVVLVLATIGLLGIGLVQARDTRASIAAVQKAANAADLSARAAIGLELPLIRSKPYPLGHGQSIINGIKREDCWVHAVEFSNHGKTKAFPIAVHYGVFVGNGALPREPNYTGVEFFEVDATYEPGPDKDYDVFLTEAAGELSDGQWSEINAGKLTVTFYCLLVYLDFMDARRERGFCWRWVKAGGNMRWMPESTPAYNRKT